MGMFRNYGFASRHERGTEYAKGELPVEDKMADRRSTPRTRQESPSESVGFKHIDSLGELPEYTANLTKLRMRGARTLNI